MENNGHFKEYKLDNGLSVALNNRNSKTVFGLIQVHYGFMHSEQDEQGIPHFLEHCVANTGSQKYPASEAEYKLKEMGNFSPSTLIEKTIYPFSVLSEDLEKTLDFLSQIIFFTGFDPEKVEGERNRVLSEIRDRKSNQIYQAQRPFIKIFYRGHPNSIEGVGDSQLIGDISISELREFHQKYYNANNSDLFIAGGLPENINEIINQFSKIRSGTDFRIKQYPSLKPLEKKLIYHINQPTMLNPENPKESLAEISIYFIVPPCSSPEYFALKAIEYSLGGCINSRLMKSLGHNKALAYSAHSKYSGIYNSGVLYVNATIPALRLEESVNALFNEIFRARKDPISERDLEILKKSIRFELANNHETNKGHVEALLEQKEEGVTFNDYLNGYKALTLADVKRTAEKYLPPSRDSENYALYISDPLKKE